MMKNNYGLVYGIILSTASCTIQAADSSIQCTEEDTPKVIKNIEDYTIIAGNTAQIPISDAFKGNKIFYTVSAPVSFKDNLIMVNSRNGILTIEAKHRDNFDVSVTANNPCGTATLVFNVQIDKE